TNQIGELTYIAVAPPRTPSAPVAALRKGFEGVAQDKAFADEMVAKQGIPYSHVGQEQGQAIFRALADVSPDVIRTLRDSAKAPWGGGQESAQRTGLNGRSGPIINAKQATAGGPRANAVETNARTAPHCLRSSGGPLEGYRYHVRCRPDVKGFMPANL